MRAYLDLGSIVVMAITLILFILALFVKGVTHDLFIEAGVFLVSAKIIIMAYKSKVAASRIEKKLDAVLAALGALEKNEKYLGGKEDTAQIRQKMGKTEQEHPADRR